MRKLLFFLLLLSLLLATGSAEQQEAVTGYDAVMKQYVGFPAKLIPVLSSARDAASAQTAAPKLEALLPQLFQLREQIKQLPVPDSTSARALESRYALEMRTQWGAVFREIYRLQAAECFGSESFRKNFTMLCLILR